MTGSRDFEPPEPRPLADRAARGGAVTIAGEGARASIEAAGIVVLARLLTPEDFGLVAMVAAVVGLVSLSDFGLPAATVQRAGLTVAEWSALFWVNLGIGVAIAVCAILAAPAIAWLYGEPRLTAITMAFSLLFVLRGLSAQPAALLRRNLSFAALARINIAAVTVATVVAVWAAWLGAGPWALVVLQLSASLVASAAVWRAVDWRPSRPSGLASVRRMLSFGSDVTATRLLQLMSRNLSQILIGAVSGAAVLGLYTNAFNILFRPIMRLHSPLVPVACAVLARLQAEPERFRSYFRGGNMVLNSLTLPFLSFVAADAELAVSVVLGDRWLGLLPLLRALSLAAFVRALFMSTQWVYLSLGRTRAQLRWGVFRTSVTVAGIVVGINWGASGVALSLSISSAILLLPAIALAIRVSDLRWADFIASSARPVVACAVAVSAVFAAAGATGAVETPILRLISDAVIFGLVYVGTWLALPGGAVAAGRWLDFLRRRDG